MAEINPGDLVRIAGSFTNAAGAAADPTSVTLRVRCHADSVYTTEITNDSVGSYHYDYTVPSIGKAKRRTIYYRWEGTGAVQAVEEGSFVAVTRF